MIWWCFYYCFYLGKEKLLIFRFACVHNFTTVVFGLSMKYWHSFATVIPLNLFVRHKTSQLCCYINKPCSKHGEIECHEITRANTEKHEQVLCFSKYPINCSPQNKLTIIVTSVAQNTESQHIQYNTSKPCDCLKVLPSSEF